MDNKPTEPAPDKISIDTTLSEEASEETPKKLPEKESDSKKKARRWPFFVLAFIVGSATSIVTLNYYPFIHHTAAERMTTAMVLPSTEKNIVEKATIENTPVEPVKELVEPASTTIKTPAIIKDEVFEAPANTAISKEEVRALMTVINGLQDNIQGLQKTLQHELQTLHQKQREVADSQAMLESMQLHSRLSWITQPNNHLPQIKLAWQEISLLPSLSAEQRVLAESMLQQAQKRQDDVQQWQQEMNHLISSFKPNEHHNIISDVVLENNNKPWLQWLSQQFSLKRSQSSENALLLALKNRLQHIKQGMDLEQWPNSTAWAELRAQLQLRLVEQAGENTVPMLRLPENFTAIQADVEQLRQAAQLWLEE